MVFHGKINKVRKHYTLLLGIHDDYMIVHQLKSRLFSAPKSSKQARAPPENIWIIKQKQQSNELIRISVGTWCSILIS